MIYLYDQALQLPTVDLYDTLIMAMALNAAKDMYERGELQIKDFLKAYGDFLTPITADLNWWNLNVTGAARDLVNNIYARGGDPLRNAQDRARVTMFLNNLPYGEMAFKRERAKNAEEYYKNMATLRMNDKYNEDFSRYLQEDPNQWALDSAGVTSPTVFKDLNAATAPWVDDLEPSDLGLDPTGRYRMSGVTSDQIRQSLTPHLSGFVNSSLGKFYYDAAKAELINEGNNNPTADQIMNRLLDNIVTAQHEKTKVKYTADPYAVSEQDHRYKIAEQNNSAANQIHVHAANAEKDYEIEMRGLMDLDRDGNITDDERALYAASRLGGKDDKNRYMSYIDDVRESALQTIAGNSSNYNMTTKLNLDNLFLAAWKNAGLDVNLSDAVWKTRDSIKKQLDDILKTKGKDEYDKTLRLITDYMEKKLSVRLEPSAFLPTREHNNEDSKNPDAIVFDPHIDINKIVGSNDAILDGYGSVIGGTPGSAPKLRYLQRQSGAKTYQQYLKDLESDSNVSEIRFRSISKLIPMFNAKDKKVHFYAKVKVYGVDADGKEKKETAFTALYDWDSLQTGKNNTYINRPMNNLDYSNRGVTSAMVESMASNKLFGAKTKEYSSDDPQLIQK